MFMNVLMYIIVSCLYGFLVVCFFFIITCKVTLSAMKGAYKVKYCRVSKLEILILIYGRKQE